MKKEITYQQPCPSVVIKNPDTGKEVITFSLEKQTELLSYNFELSTNDTIGSFSLIFYPAHKNIYKKKFHFFDLIKKLYIVEIYETEKSIIKKKPTFTGIIRSKKYVASVSENGGNRKFSVSGTAITGLISQFYVNLDTSASVLTDSMANNANIRNRLTTDILGRTSIDEIINLIWDYFIEISAQYGTPKMEEYITNFIGDSIFEIDKNLNFHYPLGCVFNGETTQDFFDVVDGIIPSPVYEKFPYIDSSGKMKIIIREAPFNSDTWQALTKHIIKSKNVKNFEVTESDNEVYTVFYSYLSGYSLDQTTLLRLSQLSKESQATHLKYDSDKYKTYGYRLLSCHFIGYGTKDGDEDTTTEENLGLLNEQLKNWYGKLDEMLSGSITLAMTYGAIPIMPGDRIGFMGCEFYVDGISHSWVYGSGGEINLSISRGGKYKNGEYIGQAENITDLFALMHHGIDVE